MYRLVLSAEIGLLLLDGPVKNLFEEFRLGYENVPWEAVAGSRDITADRYQILKIGYVRPTL